MDYLSLGTCLREGHVSTHVLNPFQVEVGSTLIRRQTVAGQVISLDDAPRGYGEFDAGVPKKFVIDPHKLFSAA